MTPFAIALYNWNNETAVLYNGILQCIGCSIDIMNYLLISYTRIGRLYDFNFHSSFIILLFIFLVCGFFLAKSTDDSNKFTEKFSDEVISKSLWSGWTSFFLKRCGQGFYALLPVSWIKLVMQVLILVINFLAYMCDILNFVF